MPKFKAGDICKCGDTWHEHLEYGPRTWTNRSQCTEFRLCVTERQMIRSYDDCIKELRKQGYD
jgi:hypothetical protein